MSLFDDVLNIERKISLKRYTESLEGNGKARGLTVDDLIFLDSMNLNWYVHIEGIGPFGNGEARFKAIEGDGFGRHGYAHCAESDWDELDEFLENNAVFVWSKDIGQTDQNWIDMSSMYSYVNDVYLDLDLLLPYLEDGKDYDDEDKNKIIQYLKDHDILPKDDSSSSEEAIGGKIRKLTVEDVIFFDSNNLDEYIYIEGIGPFGNGEAQLEAIEGDKYGIHGYSHGYDEWESEGYESDWDALEKFLEDNVVFVWSKDIGQTDQNWLDLDSMYSYMEDVYLDLDSLLSSEDDDVGNKVKQYLKSRGLV